MTPKQKIELRLSEVRQRLNAIAGLEGDAFTDEIRGEAGKLQTEYADLEIRHRAAITAEAQDASLRGGQDQGDGEGAELRGLIERASVGAIVGAALSHRSTEGATAELQRHYGLAGNAIPLALLSERPVEQRAVTPAPDNAGRNLGSIVPAVFPARLADFLGIDRPTVAVGDAVFPVLSTSAAPTTPTAGSPVSETTGAFTATALSPKRIQASFFYRREDAARFGGMDEALRMNLSEALGDKLDSQILAVLLTTLDAVTVSAEDSFASYRKNLLYGRIDGTYAVQASDLRLVVGAPTLAHMSTKFLSGADSISALQHLEANTGGVRVSAHIPAVDGDNQQSALVRLGMRRDAVAPLWNGVEIIDDRVTKAGSGEIVLTAILLHNVGVLRADGFKEVETQHA